MKTKLAVWMLIAASVWAQGPGPGQGGGPLTVFFFTPESVMQNQRAIGLTDEQAKAVKAELQAAQAKFTDLQWRLYGDQEETAHLSKQERVDEAALLAAFDKVLATETEIKKTHLALLARVKNILTPEQQTKLRELRPKMRGSQPGRGPGNSVGESPEDGPPPPPE